MSVPSLPQIPATGASPYLQLPPTGPHRNTGPFPPSFPLSSGHAATPGIGTDRRFASQSPYAPFPAPSPWPSGRAAGVYSSSKIYASQESEGAKCHPVHEHEKQHRLCLGWIRIFFATTSAIAAMIALLAVDIYEKSGCFYYAFDVGYGSLQDVDQKRGSAWGLLTVYFGKRFSDVVDWDFARQAFCHYVTCFEKEEGAFMRHLALTYPRVDKAVDLQAVCDFLAVIDRHTTWTVYCIGGISFLSVLFHVLIEAFVLRLLDPTKGFKTRSEQLWRFAPSALISVSLAVLIVLPIIFWNILFSYLSSTGLKTTPAVGFYCLIYTAIAIAVCSLSLLVQTVLVTLYAPTAVYDVVQVDTLLSKARRGGMLDASMNRPRGYGGRLTQPGNAGSGCEGATTSAGGMLPLYYASQSRASPGWGPSSGLTAPAQVAYPPSCHVQTVLQR